MDEKEKLLVIVKNRSGHTCEYSWVIVAICLWEGITRKEADESYDLIAYKLGQFGKMTERRNGTEINQRQL